VVVVYYDLGGKFGCGVLCSAAVVEAFALLLVYLWVVYVVFNVMECVVLCVVVWVGICGGYLWYTWVLGSCVWFAGVLAFRMVMV